MNYTIRNLSIVILTVFFIISNLMSSFYYDYHKSHDCTDAECVVCIHLLNADKGLKLIKNTELSSTLFFISFMAVCLIEAGSEILASQSPVMLKVRLNS